MLLRPPSARLLGNVAIYGRFGSASGDWRPVKGRLWAFSQVPPADLDIPILSQLAPAQLPLGDALELGSLEVVDLDAPLGQEPLEDVPRHPDHAPILADLDPERSACRLVFQRASSGNGGWETVPLGYAAPQYGLRRTRTLGEAPSEDDHRTSARPTR
jgi:hypothetical protein